MSLLLVVKRGMIDGGYVGSITAILARNEKGIVQ